MVGVSKVGHFFHSLQTPPLVREVEGFEYVWEGRVVAAHPLHRRLQVEEAGLLDGGGHLGPEAAGVGRLVTHHAAPGLQHGLEHGVPVPGQNADQVYNLPHNTQ